MRRLHLLIVVVLGVASLIVPAATTARDQRLKFEAKLSGREEFPEPRNTPASGRATFELSKDGKTLSYKLKVEDIRNVFAAHIHQGRKGENGPVVVTLFMGQVGRGEFEGTLARGTISAAQLEGPLVGKTLADLLAQMLTGNTYVNVHTNDGVAPTNTGPGDFPGGEIRGQVQTKEATSFKAKLTGREEFPDPRNTPATGKATFKLSKDGKTLSYELKVEDIRNVFAAHIHQGRKGENGPVVVTLFMGQVGRGEFEGTLARGTISAAQLEGPLVGKTLADLLAQMLTGNTYVNVHTNDGVAPTNTGPGDFPGGEIRGQIERQ